MDTDHTGDAAEHDESSADARRARRHRRPCRRRRGRRRRSATGRGRARRRRRRRGARRGRALRGRRGLRRARRIAASTPGERGRPREARGDGPVGSHCGRIARARRHDVPVRVPDPLVPRAAGARCTTRATRSRCCARRTSGSRARRSACRRDAEIERLARSQFNMVFARRAGVHRRPAPRVRPTTTTRSLKHGGHAPVASAACRPPTPTSRRSPTCSDANHAATSTSSCATVRGAPGRDPQRAAARRRHADADPILAGRPRPRDAGVAARVGRWRPRPRRPRSTPTQLGRAHERYAAERDAALPAGHDGPAARSAVSAGTRRGVKCLHAHYAWYLAGGDDPVGAWVAARARRGRRA